MSPRKTNTKKTPSRFAGILRGGILTLLVILILLVEPRSFRAILGCLIKLEAGRQGIALIIGRVDGSLWQPLVLVDSVWTYAAPRGLTIRAEVRRVQMLTVWKSLFRRDSGRWFRDLEIEGVQAKVQIPGELAKPDAPWLPNLLWKEQQWLGMPAHMHARDVNLMIAWGKDYTFLEDTTLEIGESGLGSANAGKVSMRIGEWSRTFRKVKGRAALINSKLQLDEIEMEKGVVLTTFSVDFANVAPGHIFLDATLAAFRGKMRMQTIALSSEGTAGLDATVNLEDLDFGQMANFFGETEAAGGTIRTGTFGFRGSPLAFDRAEATARVEIVNFQWEARQWDSLTFGATLKDRRLEVLDLRLKQGGNTVQFRGEVSQPKSGDLWRNSDFNAHCDAQVEDLTQLSALVLPEFKFAAGKFGLSGSLSRRAGIMQGELIASGSGIKWRDAPLDIVNAAVVIKNNALNVTTLQFIHGKDLVRATGEVKLEEPWSYHGEIRGKIADLGLYAALLEPPILPTPLRGRADVHWTGEGSKKTHAGRFDVELEGFGPLKDAAKAVTPLDANLEGTYAAGNLHFNRFTISDRQSTISADVRIRPKSVTLTGVQFSSLGARQLDADAVLPLDVWQMWPTLSLDRLVAPDVAGKLKISARQLNLQAVERLAGGLFPMSGRLDADLTAEGLITSVMAAGTVNLRDAAFSVGPGGFPLTAVSLDAEAQGNTIRIPSLRASSSLGDSQISGEITMQDLRNPGLRLAAVIQPFRLAGIGDGLPAIARVAVEGPASGAAVTTELVITSPALRNGAESFVWDLKPFLYIGSAAYEKARASWKTWKGHLTATADATFNGAARSETAQVGRLQGTLNWGAAGACGEAGRTIHIENVPARLGAVALHVGTADLRVEKDLLVGRAAAFGVWEGRGFALSIDTARKDPISVSGVDGDTEKLIRSAMQRELYSGESIDSRIPEFIFMTYPFLPPVNTVAP